MGQSGRHDNRAKEFHALKYLRESIPMYARPAQQ